MKKKKRKVLIKRTKNNKETNNKKKTKKEKKIPLTPASACVMSGAGRLHFVPAFQSGLTWNDCSSRIPLRLFRIFPGNFQDPRKKKKGKTGKPFSKLAPNVH